MSLASLLTRARVSVCAPSCSLKDHGSRIKELCPSSPAPLAKNAKAACADKCRDWWPRDKRQKQDGRRPPTSQTAHVPAHVDTEVDT